MLDGALKICIQLWHPRGFLWQDTARSGCALLSLDVCICSYSLILFFFVFSTLAMPTLVSSLNQSLWSHVCVFSLNDGLNQIKLCSSTGVGEQNTLKSLELCFVV